VAAVRRYLPIPVLSRCSNVGAEANLLDHLVGAQAERGRKFKAKRPCGANIDRKLEFCRLQHRQGGGLFAFEDTSNVEASLSKRFGSIICVAHQAASTYKFRGEIDRWNCVARCQHDELAAPGDKEPIGFDQKASRLLASKPCKGGVNLGRGTRVHNGEALSDAASGGLDVPGIYLVGWIGRIREIGDCSPLWDNFA